MTIKAKLIINVLLTTAIIIAISTASFFSMRFLQEKLSYLTEKSTPFQIRTIELQRELQRCITTLIKVNAARTFTEYKTFRTEYEESLASVENTQKFLEKISSGAPGLSDELDKIAQELFAAVEDRIHSNDAATAADVKVLQSIEESSSRFNDLDTSIRNLQSNYSSAFKTALENTRKFSDRLRSIEELRNLVRELQLIAVTVQNAQRGPAVLIARGKLKAMAARINKNEYFKSNKSIAAITTGFTDMLAEYIRLKSVMLEQGDEDSKNRATEFGNELSYNLNDLFQTLDQETMLARDELVLANGRQGGIFAQSSSANSILVANSELLALGLMVTGETNQLFTLDSLAELNKHDLLIQTLFTKINQRVQMLESSLNKLDAKKEVKILRAAAASLTIVRNEIYARAGIVTTLKKKLTAIEQANKSADKLRDIVIRQTTKGNESVSVAQVEQEKSIAAVKNMARKSLFQILGIGFVAIIVGILFGFWIYRSVLLPMRVVLDAVNLQQEQGKEKANLAEAVAGGDLGRKVIVSEVIKLDPTHMKKDEMGMVLKAIVGMNEAQVTLDKAFSTMVGKVREARESLERRVKERTEELFRTNEELNNEIRERERAEGQIRRSLREKEVLLKEIHHRVKNNMQVIYSLLNLQAKGIADSALRTMFEESRDRVNSMALIHEKLYRSEDLAHIDFREYLQSLLEGISNTYKRNDVVILVEMEKIVLDVNVGIPCGLIVNELVSNSLKHAFPEGKEGKIKVGINTDSQGNYVLFVEDNGTGFPPEVDFRNTLSLGLQLVNVLTGQIRGTIELARTEGTRFSITFPGE
jgi:two-component sensor histidine kinase